MMFAAQMQFLIGACLIYGVAADDGDDFSNNLFTDLGPLLTLFGERVTMQFMSQSMGWADNIILAMAPLGIITAIVGAIRVGGPSWLKAIIGRARESRAISEAELMSSTSHEVCELWNGHEIVRVMGKGPIREFIILSPQSNSTSNTDDDQKIPDIMRLKDERQQYLKEDDHKSTTQGDDPESGNSNNSNSGSSTIVIRNTEAPTPNLTLNVHDRLDRRELHSIAIFGVILQLGVIGYFGFASLSLLKDGARVADYAFPCTVTGTLLLVTGMLICSHVVEASTRETRYRPLGGRKARVVWLQRSGTVNDQAFDSFAIFPTDPLNLVTTSVRVSAPVPEIQKGWPKILMYKSLELLGAKTPAEAVTVIGAIICICGYVVQFVGLRGTHWSAAVFQLGATIVMTALRAWVRRNLAQLPVSQALVPGFELDWLSLALSMKPETAPWYGGNDDKGSDQIRPWTKDGKWDWEISNFQYQAKDLILKPYHDNAGIDASDGSVSETVSTVQGSKAHNIMRIRRELGKLADWHGPASTEAISLARAIEITMDTLFKHSTGEDMSKLSWSLPVRDGFIHFRLERGPTGSWKAFADELEAALSLWLYYINDAQETEQKQRLDEESNITAKAYHVKDTYLNDDAWLRAEGTVDKRNLRLLDRDCPRLRRDLSWWMPNDAAKVFRIKRLESNKERGSVEADVVEIEEELISISRTIEIEKHRIVGLTADSILLKSDGEFKFPVSMQDGREAESEIEIKEEPMILAVDSYGPLKTLLAQYMFSTFMWTSVKKLNKELLNEIGFSGVEVMPGNANSKGRDSTWQSFSLHNAQLSIMAQTIHNTGIGSLEDVYLSIIPPLSKWNSFPQLDAVAHMVRKHAQPLENLGRWEEAGSAYLWLFEISHDSNIATKATALLMEYLRVVKAAVELRKDQQTDYDTLEKLSSRVFQQLKNDGVSSGTVYDMLEYLYKEQGRLWKSGLQRNHPKVPDRTFGFTNLHRWAKEHESSWIIKQEAHGTDINSLDILEWTPLHYCVSAKPHNYGAEGIIGSGANVNAQDIRGLTPLHVACWEEDRHGHVLELLRNGAGVNMVDADGRAPLHHAAEHGCKAAVRSLIQAGANINLIDSSGFTPLLWAAYKGYAALIDDLWSDQHNKLRDHNGRTPLHIAAIGVMGKVGVDTWEKAKLDVLEKLINKDADKEARDRFDRTPLEVAITSSNKAITKKLLDMGADRHVKTINGGTLLHLAATESDKNIVQLLLDNSFNIKARNNTRQSPLHFAAKFRNEDGIKPLLDRGADIEAKDHGGMTPLHWAVAKFENEDIVKLLLDRGADIEARDKDQESPLHFAVRFRNEDIAKSLLDRGADIEARNDTRQTPLHIATGYRNEEVIKLLLDRGADIEAKDREGMTPLHWAVAMGGKLQHNY